MKKITTFWIALSALLALSSCAKQPATPLNDSAKRYFDSWVQVEQTAYPMFLWEPTALGSYILWRTDSTGDLIGDAETDAYVAVEYTQTDIGKMFVESIDQEHFLCGEVTASTSAGIASQIGSYDEASYYGPRIWRRKSNGLTAGIEEVIGDMKVGERCYFVSPGWLQTTKRYDTAEQYLAYVSGTNIALDVKVCEVIQDINQYQLDSMETYMAKHYPEKEFSDSLCYGCYYIRTKEPTDTTAIDSAGYQYVNYTGRLLNGHVFDTTIADTAKVHGIYNSSKTYEPVYAKWSTTNTGITLTTSGNSVITGFSITLYQMRHYEKGVGIFYSTLGYGESGSGMSIPPYSPLIFEFETMDTKE